ncbi:MAG: DUF1592 domain-containing protein, partial [Sandaracinaceae bacterium]|nr:DUF1592 domain-containing protein [Sandaracinaceae bacterium]
ASVADVFEIDVAPRTPLDPDETSFALPSLGAARVATSARGVELYREAALDVATQVMERASEVPGLAGCAPETSTDPCIDRAIARFARRLYRRSPSTSELARLRAIVSVAGEEPDLLAMGLRYAIAAMLASPSFLYVPAIGVSVSPTRARYEGWVVASRLSFVLWGSSPDDALLDAADRGELDTAEGVMAAASRMLDDPRADDLAYRFLAQSWHLDALSEASKNTEIFPDWSPELLASFRDEARLFVSDLDARDADFLEVIDGTETFVDARTASFYGLDAPAEGHVRVALPEARVGLLTSGLVLAATSRSNGTTPTHRGIFTLEHLLCRTIPAPPPGAADRAAEIPADVRRTHPSCAACHGQFDPLGDVFERFDAIGADHSERALPGILDDAPVSDPRALAAWLRASPETERCMARELYTFATAREPLSSDEPALRAITHAFADGGHSFRALVLATVTSDDFRFFDVE